jgi:hypothetical protein
MLERVTYVDMVDGSLCALLRSKGNFSCIKCLLIFLAFLQTLSLVQI